MTNETYYAVIYDDAIYGTGVTKEEACENALEWLDEKDGVDPEYKLSQAHVEPITKTLYDHVEQFGGGQVPTERVAGGLLDYDPYWNL